MKKILSLFICINFLLSNFAFAFVDVFEDNLSKNLDKNLKIQKQEKKFIQDDFVSRTLNTDLKIQKQSYKPLKDEFVNSVLKSDLKIQKNKQTIVEDELALLLKNKNIERKIVDNKVGLITGNTSKIKIIPLKYYTTRTNLFEGEYIDFVLASDVKIKNKIYKKESLIKARVENVSPNGAYGVPADVIIGNFVLEDKTKLDGEISLQGANRSLWVYPVGHIMTLLLGLGIFIYPIRGGHAKFKTNKVYEFESFE